MSPGELCWGTFCNMANIKKVNNYHRQATIGQIDLQLFYSGDGIADGSGLFPVKTYGTKVSSCIKEGLKMVAEEGNASISGTKNKPMKSIC